VFFRELCQPERRPAERLVGLGRGAAAAPDRSHDVGSPPRGQPRAVHGEVSGAAAALRAGGGSHQSRQRPRERRLRARPPALQGGPGASAAAARQPGLCQSPGVRAAGAGGRGPAERGPGRTLARGAGAAAAVTGAAAGGAGAGTAARAPGEHDPRQGEHLLGAGPADRRSGGGACRRGGARGVVRRRLGASDGAAPRPGQASHRLPACQWLAAAQAGGVRALRVPRGPVPDRDVPAGLRRPGGAAAGAGGQGVRAAAAPGDAGG
jgi:hypothetical protein